MDAWPTVARVEEGLPPWEVPFVVEVQAIEPERHGVWDLYAPDDDGPRPVVVFVHGGPISVDPPVLHETGPSTGGTAPWRPAPGSLASPSIMLCTAMTPTRLCTPRCSR